MCEGYMGKYPHISTNPSAKPMKMLLVKQIYAWGKTQAIRNGWFADFINPKSIN